MHKRVTQVNNAITILAIALLIILIFFVLIFYNYYDVMFSSQNAKINSKNYYPSYSDNDKTCTTLLVPYTEREIYFEKVPAYSFFNSEYQYQNNNLEYKVWIDQESIENSRNEVTELITIKIENRDNVDGYFDVSVIFSPYGQSKVTKQKSSFIREDDSQKFEFEYKHDEDEPITWTYDIDSQSELEFEYIPGRSPYPYSHIFYKNDYIYDYDNCFHGYCKPTQVISYREVPRIKLVTKYKEVVQCN